ncbi:MAG TPA: ubiquinol oxidase subunit II [Steroidobacteraceae bacterium]
MQWAVAVPLAALSGCDNSILNPIGPIGAAERTILLDSFAIMMVIAIPTVIATLAFAWWFRASNARARYLPTWAYSGRLELIVWSIPLLVILFLGGITWLSSHELDPARPLKSKLPPLEIQVVSLDWKWLFIYPAQGIATINQLIVPIGMPLHLSITSATVMNVFFVPRLGSEIYCMNGMRSQLNLQADQPGVYPGLSAHFSGDGFPGMTFKLHAVTAQQFAEWAATTRSAGPALDDGAYRGLLRQSENVRPYTYRSVRAGLFADILTQKLPPGEGPTQGRPSPAVHPAQQ